MLALEKTHYIYYLKTNDKDQIVDFWSTGANGPLIENENWHLLTDKGETYQFSLDGEENPYERIFDEEGIPLLKWSNGTVMSRMDD